MPTKSATTPGRARKPQGDHPRRQRRRDAAYVTGQFLHVNGGSYIGG